MKEKRNFDEELYDEERKSIPNSLNECCKPNKMVLALRRYGKSFIMTGRILFVAIIIYGFISGIISSLAYEEFTDSVISFLIEFVVYSFWGIVVVEMCAFLCVLLNAASNLVYNNCVTANVALYEANKKEPTEE